MAENTYEDGLTEGRLRSLESSYALINGALEKLGDRVTGAMNDLGRSLREEIAEEVVPIRKAVVGNGDPSRGLCSRMERAETNMGLILKIGVPVLLALIGAGIGAYLS